MCSCIYNCCSRPNFQCMEIGEGRLQKGSIAREVSLQDKALRLLTVMSEQVRLQLFPKCTPSASFPEPASITPVVHICLQSDLSLPPPSSTASLKLSLRPPLTGSSISTPLPDLVVTSCGAPTPLASTFLKLFILW